ncbi:conserved hypothetical protein [Delftia phage PhiW-14]|uniref:DUF4815 domain-containing protein n=1 Tax=Delftia phage PhiW-14 TaxID=665032 RepID=C9DG24_BPW14|nr:hypothetical protein DP-phiW-14_gp053 [Delftia phage PhiW-14]ACV50075.1 conserved hypothetical protein [Delftia phage PhiW-14]
MSDLQQTDLNVPPFFDDYEAAKNFHRILFRPGRTVQARELTQLQTILQDQINRTGRHLFEEGAIVIPGGVNATTEQDFITCNIYGDLDLTQFQSDLADLYVKSGGTGAGIEAKVLAIRKQQGLLANALAVEYQSAETGTGRPRFIVDESVFLVRRVDGQDTLLATLTVIRPDKGILVSVAPGVYFVRGHLVRCEGQTILAETEDVTAFRRAGFTVTETLVTEEQDPSLFSNASGFPNYKAPGAARLKFDLTLSSNTEDVADPTFVELVRFSDGKVQRKVEGTAYSIIMRAIEQRTYETNGDYTVYDYPITMLDHLRDAKHPDGVFPAPAGDNSKYVARLGQGVSYVLGRRSEINGFEDIIGEKARDTAIANNDVMYPNYGSFIVVKNVKSLPKIDIKQVFDFLAADGTTKVGTFRCRATKRDNSTLRMFIFDVKFLAGKTFYDAKKVKYSDISNYFEADMSGDSIFDSTLDSSVFPLAYPAVKTMAGAGGQDTSYSVVRAVDIVLDAQGVGSISLVASESFNPVDPYNYAVALTGASTPGTQFDPMTSLSVGGSPVGRTLNVNLGASQAGKTVRVQTSVLKMNPAPKVKTLKTATATIVFDVENRKKLPHADVIRLVSVVNTTNQLDEVAAFSHFTGQRPNWYEVGEIYTKSGANLRQTYSVTYQYFEHSMGDYFTVDSYGGMAREDIPKTKETAARKEVSLADCLDFRQVKDASGNFTSSTFNGDMVDPSASVRYDLTYYMSRVDGVYLDADGRYLWLRGTSSLEQILPRAPANTMLLFNLFVPAYTENIKDIMVSKIDNRRYTMRDIGGLERRIGNLEYYTSLTMLEQKTKTTQVKDPVTGNDRYKNGFFADGFDDSSRCDFLDSQWGGVLDVDTNRIQAPIRETVTSLIYVSGSNVRHVGDLATIAYDHRLISEQPYATDTTNINPYAVFTWTGRIKATPNNDFWVDTIWQPPTNTYDVVYTDVAGVSVRYQTYNKAPTLVNKLISHTFWSQTQTRTFLTDQITSDNVRSETLLLESAPIEYMRPIEIVCELENFRPQGRLYGFFGGVPVSQYMRPWNGFGPANPGDPIMVSSEGKAKVTFNVPNSAAQRFRTGETELKFSDIPTGENLPTSVTSGKIVFESGGIRQVKRVDNYHDMKIRQNLTYIQEPYDPIAQTFFVTPPGGMYLSKVNVYFAHKAQTIPVTMEIRTNLVGLPTNQVLVFGAKTIYPSQITTSADGSVPTAFEFDDPPFLEANTEYSIVLVADTQEYEVYKAVMGNFKIGTREQVTKQPDMGVFLTSANAMTWTPHQFEDLKLQVYAANFTTNTPAITLVKSGKPDAVRAAINAFLSTNGNATVTMNIRSHGLRPGDKFVVSGAAAGNGYLANELNKEHTVITVVDLDQVTVTMPKNATSDGVFGGETIIVQTNMPISEFRVEAGAINRQGTSLVWEYQYTRQASRAKSGWVKFDYTDQFVSLPEEGVLINEGDFEIRCTMNTTDGYMTPLFDLNGGAISFRHRRIHDSIPYFSYVSNSLKYDNPNTAFRCWANVRLPGSNRIVVQIKPMTTGDQNLNDIPWTTINPTKPVVNDSKSFQEIEYNYTTTVPFVGVKQRIVFFGSDSTDTPEIEDFRSVALA